MGSTGEEDERLLLAEALNQAGYTVGDLWLKFFAIGGSVGEYEVEAYLSGLILLPPLQRDLLAHAANELINELPPPLRAPYSDDSENGLDVEGSNSGGSREPYADDQRDGTRTVDIQRPQSAEADPEQEGPGGR
ncbi:hypothetical protein [Arthrobacter sp. Br18]|uniref:hypothetical protein n=1 Tax=Arthrobacter sp. Br18 TaxID=1312954 RepID=UPI0004B6DA0A|nr:hypothetical protein [Arthrobacter sp. Br18]